jgi:hypothetical protein
MSLHSGVKLLNLDTDDKAAAAAVIPSKTPNPNPKTAPYYSNRSIA